MSRIPLLSTKRRPSTTANNPYQQFIQTLNARIYDLLEDDNFEEKIKLVHTAFRQLEQKLIDDNLHDIGSEILKKNQEQLRISRTTLETNLNTFDHNAEFEQFRDGFSAIEKKLQSHIPKVKAQEVLKALEEEVQTLLLPTYNNVLELISVDQTQKTEKLSQLKESLETLKFNQDRFQETSSDSITQVKIFTLSILEVLENDAADLEYADGIGEITNLFTEISGSFLPATELDSYSLYEREDDRFKDELASEEIFVHGNKMLLNSLETNMKTLAKENPEYSGFLNPLYNLIHQLDRAGSLEEVGRLSKEIHETSTVLNSDDSLSTEQISENRTIPLEQIHAITKQLTDVILKIRPRISPVNFSQKRTKSTDNPVVQSLDAAIDNLRSLTQRLAAQTVTITFGETYPYEEDNSKVVRTSSPDELSSTSDLNFFVTNPLTKTSSVKLTPTTANAAQHPSISRVNQKTLVSKAVASDKIIAEENNKIKFKIFKTTVSNFIIDLLPELKSIGIDIDADNEILEEDISFDSLSVAKPENLLQDIYSRISKAENLGDLTELLNFLADGLNKEKTTNPNATLEALENKIRIASSILTSPNFNSSVTRRLLNKINLGESDIDIDLENTSSPSLVYKHSFNSRLSDTDYWYSPNIDPDHESISLSDLSRELASIEEAARAIDPSSLQLDSSTSNPRKTIKNIATAIANLAILADQPAPKKILESYKPIIKDLGGIPFPSFLEYVGITSEEEFNRNFPKENRDIIHSAIIRIAAKKLKTAIKDLRNLDLRNLNKESSSEALDAFNESHAKFFQTLKKMSSDLLYSDIKIIPKARHLEEESREFDEKFSDFSHNLSELFISREILISRKLDKFAKQRIETVQQLSSSRAKIEAQEQQIEELSREKENNLKLVDQLNAQKAAVEALSDQIATLKKEKLETLLTHHLDQDEIAEDQKTNAENDLRKQEQEIEIYKTRIKELELKVSEQPNARNTGLGKFLLSQEVIQPQATKNVIPRNLKHLGSEKETFTQMRRDSGQSSKREERDGAHTMATLVPKAPPTWGMRTVLGGMGLSAMLYYGLSSLSGSNNQANLVRFPLSANTDPSLLPNFHYPPLTVNASNQSLAPSWSYAYLQQTHCYAREHLGDSYLDLKPLFSPTLNTSNTSGLLEGYYNPLEAGLEISEEAILLEDDDEMPALINVDSGENLFTAGMNLVSQDIIATLPQTLTQANKSSAGIEFLLSRAITIQPMDQVLQAQELTFHSANLLHLLPQHVETSYVDDLLESVKTAEGFTNLVAQQELEQQELKKQEHFIENEISILQRIYQANSQSPTLQDKLRETVQQSQEQIAAITANLGIRHHNEKLAKQEDIARTQIDENLATIGRFKADVATFVQTRTLEFPEVAAVDIKASALQKARTAHPNLDATILNGLINEKFADRVSEQQRQLILDQAEADIQKAKLLHPISFNTLTADQKLLLSTAENTGFAESATTLDRLAETFYKKQAQAKIDNQEVDLLSASINEQVASDQAAANYLLQQDLSIQYAITRSRERIAALESEPDLDSQFKNKFPNLTDSQRAALIQKFSYSDLDGEKTRITTEHQIQLTSPHIQSVIDGLTPVQLALLPTDQFASLQSDVGILQNLEENLSDKELAKKITKLTLDWQVGEADRILDQIASDIAVRTDGIRDELQDLQFQIAENPEFDVNGGISKIIADFPQLSQEGQAAATAFAETQLRLLPSTQPAQRLEDTPIQAHRESYQRAAAPLLQRHQERDATIKARKFQLSAEHDLFGANETKSLFETAEKDRFDSSLRVEERRFYNELTDLQFHYLHQIVNVKIADNLQAIARLVEATKVQVLTEEQNIGTQIAQVELINPEEEAIANVSTYISKLEIAEESGKERLAEIYAARVRARFTDLDDIEPQTEIVAELQELLAQEKQQNTQFVQQFIQDIGEELTPFLTKDSLAQFASFEASLNLKTDQLHEARLIQAKNAAIAERLGADVVAEIEMDVARLTISFTGTAPANCDATIQNLRTGIRDTKTATINKEDAALAEAQKSYEGFSTLTSEEQERLTQAFEAIIKTSHEAISADQKDAIILQAHEKFDAAESTNSDLISEFVESFSESQKLLLTEEQTNWLADARSFLNHLAQKLYDAEIATKINNLEAEALATNVAYIIKADLAAIEVSRNARQVEIDNIVGQVGELPEPAAIEDTTFVKVTSNSTHLLFGKQLSEATVKEIISQELAGLKSDSTYQDSVASRQVEHDENLDRIRAKKFLTEPTAQEKTLFTNAMQADFDNQENEFREYTIDLTEKHFRINSAQKDATSLTTRVNTRLQSDIEMAESFIEAADKTMQKGTDIINAQLILMPPKIIAEESAFDAMNRNDLFAILPPDILKQHIAAISSNLQNNTAFKQGQDLVTANHNHGVIFESGEVESKRADLTPNHLLLLNGDPEFESFDQKLGALKDLESTFSAEHLAAELAEDKAQFLTKNTSDNIIAIYKIADAEKLKATPSTEEELHEELKKTFPEGMMLGAGMMTTAIAILLFAQSGYQPTSANKSKSETPTSIPPITTAIPAPSSSPSTKGIATIIPLVNKNSQRDEAKTTQAKTHHTTHWYNNKKLLKVLSKVADCDFKKLKDALNSKDNRNHKFLADHNLTSGDLAVLDALDELHQTNRAKHNFTTKTSERANLKEMLSLIPKTGRDKFFAFDKDHDVELRITKPGTGPKNPAAQKLHKTTKARV
ncbi:MAG: hypothetical protein V4694_00075 [Pseudomonadota bacterium]